MTPNRNSHPEIDRALYIAAHFGFRPIDGPKVGEKDREMVKDCAEVENKDPNHFVCDPSEKAAFLRTYIERNYANEPHPLALAWRKNKTYSLELVGFPFGIAEAKLIRTSLSILSEEGYRDLVVEVNSIGDKDSIASYEHELHNYVRKISHNLTSELRTRVKENLFSLLELEGMEAPVPQSVATLTAPSRIQFKEVLDYLEALGVDFRIVPKLIGNSQFCTETLFAVRDSVGTLLAGGFRYSRLSKRFGLKKELSLMGANIYADAKKVSALKVYKDVPHPRFHFIHLGREARLRALPLIELLRTNHIPMYHFLGRDKITLQMQTAETLRVPYLIIIGQKEALEGTATVRNMSTRAQDTIVVSELPYYLKHLKI
jgi:histidyl-tRNA synthetase